MKALITGASGFLGGALARALRARGDEVVALQRGEAPTLAALGVDVRCADIADADAVCEAAQGCEIVFHVAAKAGHWGKHEDYYRANVRGTRNVLQACRQHAIRRLVYTSTPSVVHAGADIEGGDERLPYAQRFLAWYPATKAAAEREVLAANGPELATVALRPHLIWGPGDNHLLPRIVARARAGRLRFIGAPGKRIDATYIDNAVEAHVAAGDALRSGAPHAGRAYFVSNGEPIAIEDMINRLLDCAGLPAVHARISFRAAYAIGALLELVWHVLPLRGEPPLTRFVADHLATSHWYDIGAAERDFGWKPGVSMEAGFAALRRVLRG